jgi:Flp pilus assembly protein TadB
LRRLRAPAPRRVSRARGRQRVVASGDWPLAIDVLAACLGAGATITSAVTAAAAAAPLPLAQAMLNVAAALRDGRPPDEVWAAAARSCSELDGVAGALRRTTVSGAANAGELMRLAARERARRSAVMRRAVGRASTWVVLPLGACFLPAFVLVGVVPVLIGAARELIR